MKLRRIALFALLLAGTSAAFALAEEKPKPYPLDTCIVLDEKLGDMGEPVVIVYEGQEVKFCCGGCVKSFRKDPAKYLKKIENATTNPTSGPSTHPA